MEAITNAAQAAAKAVWGTSETREEPVSGKTGNTSQGEPYDAGNMGKPRTTTGVTGSDAVKPTDYSSSGDNYTTSSERYTGTTADTAIPPLEDNYDPAGGSAKSVGNTDTTTTGVDSNRYTENTDSTNLAPLEDNYDPAGGANKIASSNDTVESTTGAPEQRRDDDYSTNDNNTTTTTTTTTNNDNDDVNLSGRDKTSSSAGPHKELGSSTEPGKDMSKAQQDVRDPSDPQTHPDEEAKKSNVDDSADLDKGDNPQKIDGPGPRPIEEVAKEYGGDAGNAKPEDFGKKGGEGDKEDEDGDGPQKTSHGEGTGEKYVKSSGLKADGGDFDATNPGAGKEADRLLESKGVHREGGDNHGSPAGAADDDAAAAAGKEKKSLGDKIKEKLHKPHFKH